MGSMCLWLQQSRDLGEMDDGCASRLQRWTRPRWIWRISWGEHLKMGFFWCNGTALERFFFLSFWIYCNLTIEGSWVSRESERMTRKMTMKISKLLVMVGWQWQRVVTITWMIKFACFVSCHYIFLGSNSIHIFFSRRCEVAVGLRSKISIFLENVCLKVSHCMVYQRQPDVPQMQQIEVFEVKGKLGKPRRRWLVMVDLLWFCQLGSKSRIFT